MTKGKLEGMTYKQLYTQLCEVVIELENDNKALRDTQTSVNGLPASYFQELHDILGIVLNGITTNRRENLKCMEPSTEEYLLQEARSRLVPHFINVLE